MQKHTLLRVAGALLRWMLELALRSVQAKWPKRPGTDGKLRSCTGYEHK